MYRLTPTMRVLLTLHNFSAVDELRARDIEEIAREINLEIKHVEEVVKQLLEMGYVCRKNGRIYLTPLGILKILSLFS